MPLAIKIVTPERVLVEQEANEVIVPTKDGQITILPNHANLISEIASGDIVIKSKDDEIITLVYGGFVEVTNDSQVIILADSAEHLYEISEKEAEEARKRAELLLSETRDDHERFADAQAALAKSITQLKTLRKHRKKH